MYTCSNIREDPPLHNRKISVTVRPGTTYHVSKLLNFFVTTFPRSIPSRSTIRCAKSGWDVPEKTFMFGILDCILRTLDFSKLSRTKLLARIGLADRTGITQSTENWWKRKNYIFFIPNRRAAHEMARVLIRYCHKWWKRDQHRCFLCFVWFACVGTAPDKNLTKWFLNVCERWVATCTTKTICQFCQKIWYIFLWVAKLLQELIFNLTKM